MVPQQFDFMSKSPTYPHPPLCQNALTTLLTHGFNRLSICFKRNTDEMERDANEIAENVMDKAQTIIKHLNTQVKVEMMMENGDPRDVICEVAHNLKVDFLVMGSHGYGPIKRAFLGSVSNHCAQKVKCPVLIVKKPTN